MCLLLPDCFTLAAHEFQSDASAYCLLLTLVDVCGTNTPVILLSENVFLPELHQACYDQYSIAIYLLDKTLFDK